MPSLFSEGIGETNLDVGYDFPHMFAYDVAFELKELKKNNKKNFEEIKDLFKNIPIVDLGSGDTKYGKEIAQILGASGYIGVEPHNYRGLSKSLAESDRAEKNKIPYSIVPEDALTFLRRLPDHSVGIMSFGTNGSLLSSSSVPWEERHAGEAIVKDYINKCNKEILRVIHPDSAFIKRDSMFDIKDSNSVPLQNRIGIMILKPPPLKE